MSEEISFAACVSVLRKQFSAYCSGRLAEAGVALGQLYILLYAGHRDGCSPKDICQALKLDAGYLNRELAKLTERGMITQEKNESDRRGRIIRLTERGRDVVQLSRSLFREWDEMILSPLDRWLPSHRNRLLKHHKFRLTMLAQYLPMKRRRCRK